MQRRLSFAALILSCALVLASCQDVPTSTPDAPLFEIWDAVHGGGNEHFFWLPPMITPMPTYAGVFDGAADPTVQICEGAVSSCETPVITFSATAGLTVNALDEWYGADWYVFDQDPEVEVNDIFRISVLASGQELGFADLLIVDKVTGQLKNELDDEYILLSETQGRKFLKIRFRIEEGAMTGRSPVLLYATGKIPSRIISVVDVTDLNAMTLLDWGISLDLLGRDVHGVDVDASDNVIFAGGWSQQPWFGVVDATLAIVGETTVSDGVLGDPLDVAFRSPEQAVACSRVAPGNLSRLLVFDVSDLANPVQTGASDIPGTGNVDGCRAIAFDEQGDLWVTTGGDGNLVRMTLDASGAPTSTQVTPLNYPWGVIEMAIEPGTSRVFLSLINSGHIGVVDLADPSTSVALVTNVCESALGSPQGLEFSSAGDLFVGCSNYSGATDDLKAIPASSLVGLGGTVSAATLDVRGADLGPPGVVVSDGTMAFLAIAPAPPGG